jgi:hypothetical protein
MIAQQFYNGAEYVPGNKIRKMNISVDVLIDVDGKRETFVMGWFDFDLNHWVSGDDHFQKVVLSKMKWAFLPLRRLDGREYKVIGNPVK